MYVTALIPLGHGTATKFTIYSGDVGNDYAMQNNFYVWEVNQLVQVDRLLEYHVWVIKDRVYHVQLAFQCEETKHGGFRLLPFKQNVEDQSQQN